MGIATQVARQSRVSVKKAGGLRLVDSAESGEFLRGCVKRRVLILGVEGLRIAGDHVYPDMDAIADFSEIRDVEEAAREAERFIASVRKPGMFFDFTLAREVE